MAISPDAKIVASADHEVGAWDISADAQLVRRKRFGNHGRCVSSLAFSPDGRTLVSCSDDGKIKVWEVATGRLANSRELPNG